VRITVGILICPKERHYYRDIIKFHPYQSVPLENAGPKGKGFWWGQGQGSLKNTLAKTLSHITKIFMLGFAAWAFDNVIDHPAPSVEIFQSKRFSHT